MDISALNASNNTSPQSSAKRAGQAVKAAIDSIISSSRQSSATSDIANLSLAARLQANSLGLKEAAGGLALVSTQAQVANGGVAEIRSALKTLQSLAEQAKNPAITPQTRDRLSAQFREFTAKIDDTVKETTFDGKKLLDGSLAGKNALSLRSALSSDGEAETLTLSIDNLSSANLFKGKTLDLSSPENAAAALAVVNDAVTKVTDIRDQVGEFQQSVDLIAANVDSALANQTAAESLLPELDLLTPQEGNSFFSVADLQKNVTKAIAAQGNLFNPSSLLRLVS